jgi:hypothetical protein
MHDIWSSGVLVEPEVRFEARFASRRMNLESTEHVRLDTRLKVETKPPDKGVVII